MLGLSDRSRSRIAVLSAVVVSLLSGALLALGVVACDDLASGGLAPTTGILIRAETLTTGKGCGAGPTQVFKYVVVVYRYTDGDPQSRNSYRTFQTASIFDCFVDGEFVSLPSNVGNNVFRLETYVFNQAAYVASQGPIDAAIRSVNDADPTNDQTSADPYRSALPTWTTECTATQALEVETLAQCDPLSPGLGGVGDGTSNPTQISVPTNTFRLPDGREAVCLPTTSPTGDAGTDSGSDAGDAGEPSDAGDAGPATDAGDAGDASVSDAGSPPPTAVAFKTVRIRPRVGGTIVSAPVDHPCGTPFVAEVGAEPASYTIDIGLIDNADQPIGVTACSATTTTGAVTVAVCP